MAQENEKSAVTGSVGLAPVRTARLIASLIALMGMVFLLIQRVLSAVMVMASDGVRMGLTRYNNFTGRFAAQNFAEDRQLLKLLKEVQDLLPMASSALTVLMIVAVVFLVVALVGLAFPRPFTHVLVALKLLKWADADNVSEEGGSLRETLKKLGEVPLKKLAIPAAVIVVVLVVGFTVSTCHDRVLESSTSGAVEELEQQALAYITAQRDYFAKNKALGNAKALQLSDRLVTEASTYRVTPSRFVATSNQQLGKCPAGSKWSLSATVKGVFNKELSLYRGVPKDSSCAVLTPNYKQLGRRPAAE
jgi:hypothetical protein